MNIWDILILAAVAAALFFAFRAAAGNRKNCCCGGCRGCRKNDRACPSCRSAKQENNHEKN